MSKQNVEKRTKARNQRPIDSAAPYNERGGVSLGLRPGEYWSLRRFFATPRRGSAHCRTTRRGR